MNTLTEIKKKMEILENKYIIYNLSLEEKLKTISVSEFNYFAELRKRFDENGIDAFYSSDKASQETLVVSSGDDVPYEGGKTYYLLARKEMKNDEEFKKFVVTFSEDFKKLTGVTDYDEWDMEPIAITIPEGTSGDFHDAVLAEAYFENEWDERKNEYRYNLLNVTIIPYYVNKSNRKPLKTLSGFPLYKQL